MQEVRVIHPIEPIWDSDSRILILGSFPSVRSRQAQFYYAHPQNRFWPLLSRMFNEPLPVSIEERRAFALRHGIALWDVIQSCAITGSSDASIRDVQANDLSALLSQTQISRIFLNGQQAFRLYERYCTQSCAMPAIPLPSTSPANAAWSMDRLMEAWKVIRSVPVP